MSIIQGTKLKDMRAGCTAEEEGTPRHLAQLVVHEERDVLGRARRQVDEVLERRVERVLERLVVGERRADDPARVCGEPSQALFSHGRESQEAAQEGQVPIRKQLPCSHKRCTTMISILHIERRFGGL